MVYFRLGYIERVIPALAFSLIKPVCVFVSDTGRAFGSGPGPISTALDSALGQPWPNQICIDPMTLDLAYFCW